MALTHHNKKIRCYELFECASLRTLAKPRQLYGADLYLVDQKLENGNYFIVGSATRTKRLAQIDQHRWQIETLFLAFKWQGFNLESLWVNLAKRIKTFLFVLSMAAIWTVKTGQCLLKQGNQS